MSERINLAELRTREPGLIWTEEVEALVEAVEAAHARGDYKLKDWLEARFDFGEAQP